MSEELKNRLARQAKWMREYRANPISGERLRRYERGYTKRSYVRKRLTAKMRQYRADPIHGPRWKQYQLAWSREPTIRKRNLERMRLRFQLPEVKLRQKIYARKWSKTDNGRAATTISNLRRRIRLHSAIGSFSPKEWLELKNRSPICSGCGKNVGCRNLTIDHIIPLSRGGTNYISNIQPLCKPCNSRKKNKII